MRQGHSVIGWSKYRLRLLCVTLHCAAHVTSGNFHHITKVTDSPLAQPPGHSPNGRQMPAIRAVRGDCERVCQRQEGMCPSKQPNRKERANHLWRSCILRPEQKKTCHFTDNVFKCILFTQNLCILILSSTTVWQHFLERWYLYLD